MKEPSLIIFDVLLSSMIHRSIERDMKTVSSALEYSYKVNKEANAQALEQATAAAPSSNTPANQ